jgi:hypothetical protein
LNANEQYRGSYAKTLLLVAAAAPARGQGGMDGMKGMRHDPAFMSRMSVIHELIVDDDRIRRTVTNLLDGIRTVTE